MIGVQLKGYGLFKDKHPGWTVERVCQQGERHHWPLVRLGFEKVRAGSNGGCAQAAPPALPL